MSSHLFSPGEQTGLKAAVRNFEIMRQRLEKERAQLGGGNSTFVLVILTCPCAGAEVHEKFSATQ